MHRDTLKDFAAEAENLSREDFVQKYPHPFLVGQGASTVSSQAFQTQAGFKAAPLEDADRKAEKDLPVHRIVKSDRNTFGTMITLGRSDNNDVVLDPPSVSKFHAYFSGDPGQPGSYKVCDADSRYGTFKGEKRMRPSVPQPLKTGDTLVFGKSSPFVVYFPADFYDYLKVLKGLKKL